MAERLAAPGAVLPKGDGRVLVESIRSLEHGQRTLQLIARHVAAKREFAGALELDWPTRKKWLGRICELSLRAPNCKPLILDIFANADAFALSTYFAADMVDLLGAAGAETALLTKLIELFKAKRPAGCKGVAAAYHRLLRLMRERKDETAATAAAATLKALLAAPAAPAPVAPAPVAVPPPATA
ncbi:hypothetical protein CHLRE_06g290350v5 [Chlamydomonas reinhardtii]|uniref:Uncharacterized protein n=1 Tax=Chlamydomonas reinhardtii TaxID=3055 RepID=A0A2K3DQ98_CHLRE|nr:uncharacterized protein CHLRE_06g290350v5 [Chlamydomonas reinhardtii]PNW82703.1 hypothetical protein CHLRE_06g290350v5 [Chlamydomonas reinhardtii]